MYVNQFKLQKIACTIQQYKMQDAVHWNFHQVKLPTASLTDVNEEKVSLLHTFDDYKHDYFLYAFILGV